MTTKMISNWIKNIKNFVYRRTIYYFIRIRHHRLICDELSLNTNKRKILIRIEETGPYNEICEIYSPYYINCVIKGYTMGHIKEHLEQHFNVVSYDEIKPLYHYGYKIPDYFQLEITTQKYKYSY